MNKSIFVLTAAIGFNAATLSAADLVIYPADGQTKEQQQADEGACYVWAKNESGFDPLAPKDGLEGPKKKRGAAVRGAALGAMIGDDSDAAKTGASVSLARQGMKNKRAERATDRANTQIEAEYEASLEHFNRANVACLEGKGYVVK